MGENYLGLIFFLLFLHPSESGQDVPIAFFMPGWLPPAGMKNTQAGKWDLLELGCDEQPAGGAGDWGSGGCSKIPVPKTHSSSSSLKEKPPVCSCLPSPRSERGLYVKTSILSGLGLLLGSLFLAQDPLRSCSSPASQNDGSTWALYLARLDRAEDEL